MPSPTATIVIIQFSFISLQPCLVSILLLGIIICHCAANQSSADYAKTRSRVLSLPLEEVGGNAAPIDPTQRMAYPKNQVSDLDSVCLFNV